MGKPLAGPRSLIYVNPYSIRSRLFPNQDPEIMSEKLQIVGELMNNSYARARKAFTERDPRGYQELAKLQAALGAIT